MTYSKGRILLDSGFNNILYDILSVNKVPKAYVLLSVETGKMAHVMKALKNIPQIIDSDSLYGVYDIICKIEAPTDEELRGTMPTIRRIDGIKATITMLVS